SVTLVLPPPKLTRAPLAGGCSPSSPSSTPALVRDSLYLVILATRSAGGVKSAAAFSYPLGITSIMNRIVLGSFRFRVRAGPISVLWKRRIRGPGIDRSFAPSALRMTAGELLIGQRDTFPGANSPSG